jgi:hypothetical protein
MEPLQYNPSRASDGEPAQRAEVARLVELERHFRDRGDWSRMRAAYIDGARIRVTWFRGEIDDFVARSQLWGSAVSKHRLANPLVCVAGARALAETSAQVEIRTEAEGVALDITASCRLLSRVVRTEDGWRLASLDAIYEKDAISTVVPGERLAIDRARLNGQRASYRYLAYFTRGAVPDDLPGDDRPESVAALVNDALAWVNGGTPR